MVPFSYETVWYKRVWLRNDLLPKIWFWPKSLTGSILADARSEMVEMSRHDTYRFYSWLFSWEHSYCACFTGIWQLPFFTSSLYVEVRIGARTACTVTPILIPSTVSCLMVFSASLLTYNTSIYARHIFWIYKWIDFYNVQLYWYTIGCFSHNALPANLLKPVSFVL